MAFLAAATQIDDVDVGECILPVNLRDRDFPAVWRKAEIHVLAERSDGAVDPALTRLPHQIGASSPQVRMQSCRCWLRRTRYRSCSKWPRVRPPAPGDPSPRPDSGSNSRDISVPSATKRIRLGGRKAAPLWAFRTIRAGPPSSEAR